MRAEEIFRQFFGGDFNFSTFGDEFATNTHQVAADSPLCVSDPSPHLSLLLSPLSPPSPHPSTPPPPLLSSSSLPLPLPLLLPSLPLLLVLSPSSSPPLLLLPCAPSSWC